MRAPHPDSYYAATANPFPEQPALSGQISCDVCVIGGGYTGLSASLCLAERGYDVVLLEAERIGWGASGRNGGQVGSGHRRGEADLEQSLGKEEARRLWDLAEEAKRLVKSRIARHGIKCDLTPGQLVAASKPSHAKYLEDRVHKLSAEYNYQHIRFVPENELPSLLGARGYYGGAVDDDAAHLHPLNYALGLGGAALQAGVKIFEGARVSSYSCQAPSQVRTTAGSVVARYVVIACNGYLDKLEPRLAGKIMPINNFVVATQPLEQSFARRLIRDNVCVHDTFFVVNYYRRSADGRLIFGGGENYRRSFPRDIASFVRKPMLKVFPQLKDVGIDYAWGGTLAITVNRMPHLGRLHPNIFFSQGYSGHGVPLASLAGEVIAEALAGTAERFDVFARLPTPTFPGGTLLRWPGLVLGMLYYSLRDKL